MCVCMGMHVCVCVCVHVCVVWGRERLILCVYHFAAVWSWFSHCRGSQGITGTCRYCYPSPNPHFLIDYNDLKKNTGSCQCQGDCAPGSRCQSRSPEHKKKRGKRDGKGKLDCRCNVMKAECLSRTHFRICFWNCASTSKWVQFCDFDVLYLQETWMCPEKPLELNDLMVIWKCEGQGMAVVICGGLQTRFPP